MTMRPISIRRPEYPGRIHPFDFSGSTKIALILLWYVLIHLAIGMIAAVVHSETKDLVNILIAVLVAQAGTIPLSVWLGTKLGYTMHANKRRLLLAKGFTNNGIEKLCELFHDLPNRNEKLTSLSKFIANTLGYSVVVLTDPSGTITDVLIPGVRQGSIVQKGRQILKASDATFLFNTQWQLVMTVAPNGHILNHRNDRIATWAIEEGNQFVIRHLHQNYILGTIDNNGDCTRLDQPAGCIRFAGRIAINNQQQTVGFRSGPTKHRLYQAVGALLILR